MAVAIVLNMLNALTCAICSLVLTPEVVVCKNNHIICNPCKGSAHFCPICSRSFVFQHVSLLYSILNELPRQCRQKPCPFIILPGDHDHAYWCGYTLSSCKLCSLSWARNDMSNHIKSSHSDTHIMEGDSFSFDWEYFNPKVSCRRVWPLIVRDQLVWTTVTNDPTKKTLIKQYLWEPNGLITINIQVEVTFSNLQTKTTFINHSLTPFLENENPMVIGSSELIKLVDKKKTLHWTDTFTINDLNDTRVATLTPSTSSYQK